MSTILRQRRTSQGNGGIRPSVVRFLETGDIDLDKGDNPWMQISLMDQHAYRARDAWAKGDEVAARAELDKCPGLPGWYLQ
jgi:hypothetical protein